MEVEEIQGQGCNKFQRIGNGRNSSGEIGPEEEEVDGELRRFSSGGGGGDGAENRLRGWHNSSRIIRVSRASGGKDRHSKVWTSKGLRDRRVRLSVTTAIQFYDLQDRLGYDQPSKAVEWLIKAAADAISELPELNSSFPETPRQLSDEKRFDSAEMELDYNNNNNNQNQVSVSKSSSTSETSKGSGLSLSRSEVRVNRVKASRERARERAMKDKDKDNRTHNPNPNPISHNSSFTELLTGGATSPTAGETNLYHKTPRQWSAGAPMDYFTPGLMGQSSSSRMQAFHLGNSIPVSPYNVAVAGDGHGHPELQQFSFVHDHFIPVVSQQPGSGGGSDYNLNFTISSSGAGNLAGGYNRGTLQSNSPSFLPHLQRFASPIDGSNVPFFLGTATPVENHHHQHLQQQQHIFYGDRLHSDHKEKGKN